MGKIQKLINTTASRALPNRYSPQDVWSDPERKGAEAYKFASEQRQKVAQRSGYPKGFSFALGDLVKLQAEKSSNKFRKYVRGDVFGPELFKIRRRFATTPHSYELDDIQGR